GHYVANQVVCLLLCDPPASQERFTRNTSFTEITVRIDAMAVQISHKRIEYPSVEQRQLQFLFTHGTEIEPKCAQLRPPILQ
ncbi:MAG: hypothetical protein CMM00_00005, partial [Rhodopirellula sp.]|nr:hypothetical protein [Rhodopirellula sp.]